MEYRNKQLNFRVTDSEYEIIQKKMILSGIKKPTAYLRKMAMDGYVIRLDLSELTEILRLARINSNNLNQVAKRANETGNIYETDIKEIQEEQLEIKELLRGILDELTKMNR